MDTLLQHLPPELSGFAVTLGLSLLIGFEREEHRPANPAGFFGGIRTFPMIGLAGFLLVEVFDNPVPFAVGLLVLGILLAVTHWGSVQANELGLTTEVAALLTFGLGAAAAHEMYRLALAVGIVAVILLHEKRGLEGLAVRVPPKELRTLLRFLLLTAVILPAVPNHSFTSYDINPFKIWLVVVAVSTVSYASYLLQLRLGDRALLLSGIVGGAYSSTVTTVVLARQSKNGRHTPLAYAGAIIAATGVMYIRLWILIILFAPAMGGRLTALFWGMSALALIVGLLLTRAGNSDRTDADQPSVSSNPLEIRSAVTFAGIFLAVLVGTRLVAAQFGGTGVLIMAAIMGAADVDPFILGLTQQVGTTLGLETAALAVVIAAATNNLMKGCYALFFGSRTSGRVALAALSALGVVSLVLFLVV
ncbi:MAG: MgtC/SapB family protein [Candidatus Sulfomarinibacteraceae bacterium]